MSGAISRAPRWAPYAAGGLALLIYLALRHGGAGTVVFGGLAVAAWWLIAVLLATGLLPVGRMARGGALLLLPLAALTLWTVLGIASSESAELSVLEALRLVALLGVALCLLAIPGRRPEPLLAAVAWAGVAIATLALLSRFQPGLLPGVAASDAGATVGAEGRLSFPLDYWNALAALLAIATPALLALAAAARSRAAAALGGAAVPVLVLAAYLTLSRGGMLALAAGVAVLLALHPRRVALLALLLPAAAGSGALIWAAERRDSLLAGFDTAIARSQGDAMTVITLVVAVAVAACVLAIAAAARSGRLPLPRPARRTAAIATLGTTVVIVAAGLAAGGVGAAADGWQDFKQPAWAGAGSDRLGSVTGRGRYQWWTAAVDAGREEPLRGIGPGTFQIYWDRHASGPEEVKNAHSLYLESFAELGVPGLMLVLALIGGTLAGGAATSMSAPSRDRALLAGAVGGCAAFATAAAFDWVWEVTLIPVAFLLLAVALARYRRPACEPAASPHAPAPLPARLALTAAALAIAVGALLPTATAGLLDRSRQEAKTGDLQAALDDAERATATSPWAAEPRLQEALVLERAGALAPAAARARSATRASPASWGAWATLARIEAARGRGRTAEAARERALALNPGAPLGAVGDAPDD